MIETTGWNRGDASIAATIGMLAGAVLIPVTVIVINKIGSYDEIFLAITVVLVGGLACSGLLSPPQKGITTRGSR